MRIAVIGCGKMGGAMLRRWLDCGGLCREQVHAVTATATEAAAVREELGVRCDTDVAGALAESDLVLLAIKPQQARATLPAWAGAVPRGQAWLSVLAGVPRATLEGLLDDRAIVTRLMPNTPCAVGHGATAVVWSPSLPESERARQRRLLACLGGVYEMPEREIDAFTALAGSGPAYVFYFLESLRAAGESLGMPAGRARELALQVVVGAAELATAQGKPAAEMRAAVTSPGGTTEAAIGTLRERGWPEAMLAAVQAARRRAGELAGG